ncbi:MAG: DNA methyltransferase [Desulfurococcaceae archaeon]
MKRYYYVFRKDYIDLSINELKSLMEIYDSNGFIEKCYDEICIAKHRDDAVYRIMNRASFIKRSGRVISIDNISSPNLDYIDEIHEYGIKWIKIHKKTSRGIDQINNYSDKLVEKSHLPVNYRRGSYLELFFINDIVLIGIPIANRRKYEDKRIYTRSIALPIDLSRLLVNLTRVKEGEVLLDPFMGTGTILIEANLMGIRTIGVDIDYSLIEIARSNLNNYCLNNYMIIHGDSQIIKYNEVDGIATNPPYGRGSGLKLENIKLLYESFINNALESVRKNRYIVFVTSSNLEKLIDEVISKYGLKVIGKHYIYVHSSLTRVVYEVRNI